MADQPSLGEQTQARSDAALEQARMKTTETVRDAARSGSSFVVNQKRLAAGELDGYACALHQTARQLHDQSQDSAGDITERVASSLDRFAGDLRDRDIGDTLDRISDFAHRQPALFIGGTVVAGFLLSRFLKSGDTDVTGNVRSKIRETASAAKDTVEEIKDSAASTYEESKSAGKEGMQEASSKESTKEPGPDMAQHRDDESYTAADVEIPVILKPREPEQHP